MSDLKTQYEYIYFEKLSEDGKTSRWRCKNNSSRKSIGVVGLYVPWRKYCFFPDTGIVLSGSCMIDIKNFMIALRDVEKAQADLFGGE